MMSPNAEADKSKDRASIENEDRTDNQKERARKTQSFGSREPAPTSKTADDNKRNPKQYPRAALISQWLTTIFTGLAFAAAAVYAHYASQQVTESQHLARSANDQVIETRKANQIAKAAVDKADARAKEANQSAKDALTNSERAWVGLGPIDILAKPAEGQSIKIRIGLLNGGKSPAVHADPVAMLSPWLFPQDDTAKPFASMLELVRCHGDKPKWDDNAGGSTVLPGVTNMTLDISSPKLNKSEVDLLLSPGRTIMNGTWASDFEDVPRSSALPNIQQWMFGVFLVGCVNYFDEFHAAHRTSFCQIYGPSDYAPNGIFNACPKGNRAD